MLEERSTSVRFRASDGTWLEGDWFEARGTPQCAVLIASAMGVRRRLYAPFASWLADSGAHALIFDYRGMGGSRPALLSRCAATLSDYAELDLPAALGFALERAGGLKLLYVGHSLGGQLMGLIRDPGIHGAMLVASQSGYWRNWSGLPRLGMGALWFAAVPSLVRMFGYLPMRLAGQGEDVPGGGALQWAEWGRDARYVGKYLEQRDGRSTFTFRRPMRAYAFADDGYAPRQAVAELLRAYPEAGAELRYVHPADFGHRAIGHFGCMHPCMRDTLWVEQRAWLFGLL